MGGLLASACQTAVDQPGAHAHVAQGAAGQDPTPRDRAAQLNHALDVYKQLTFEYQADLAARVLPASTLDTAPAHFAWMREQVGPCSDHRVMGVRHGDLARFELRCEHGVAELALSVGPDGRVDRMLGGLRSIAPAASVVAAARSAVGWRAARNRAPSFARPETRLRFIEQFSAATGAPYSCRLGQPLLANRRGGMFALHCDDIDDARLVIDLNDGDDAIRRARVVTAPIRG